MGFRWVWSPRPPTAATTGRCPPGRWCIWTPATTTSPAERCWPHGAWSVRSPCEGFQPRSRRADAGRWNAPCVGQPVRQGALVHRASPGGGGVLAGLGACHHRSGTAHPPCLDPRSVGHPPATITMTACSPPTDIVDIWMSLTSGCQRYLIGVMARLRRAEQVEQNREAVLAAARRVFLDKGYAGATVDAIAEEAGFSRGVVYSQFGSKADMFLALLERRIDERGTQDERIADELAGAEGVWELLRVGARDTVVEQEWVRLMAEFIFAVRSGLTMEQLANPAALGLDEAIGLVYRALGFPEAPEPPSWLQAGPTAVDCRG